MSLRKPIKEFHDNKVMFTDGVEDEVDLVLLATGYEITFPFLKDLSALNWQGKASAPRLFLNVFPKDDNGLFVAGLLEGAGVGWPGRALQSDLIAAYLKAKSTNTVAAQDFRNEIEEWHSAAPQGDRGGHGIFVDFLQYKRDLQRAVVRLSKTPAR